MFEQTMVSREVFGDGSSLLICGDWMKLPAEIRALAGKVQCVCLDPPFMTGESFDRRRPYGEKGWKTGTPAPKYPAYDDRHDSEKDYLRMLRKLISVSRGLLKDTGVFYLHLDWRSGAQARLICDKVFGKDCFLNEIIWGYESGGRAKKYFSRKHEVILMYARSGKYHFDLTKVPLPRGPERRNHMARAMDEQGRMYSKIVSNGKEYRYYDDEPVYPGDVWTDISHLQQRDPERTGYATQKPIRLLERMLKPVVSPGDWVADLCCGSGTALEAAERLGCRFAGLDKSPDAVAVARTRLKPENLTVIGGISKEPGTLLTEEKPEGRLFTLLGLETEHPSFPKNGTPADHLEAWETGRIEGGVFYADQCFRRSFRYPQLVMTLRTDPDQVRAVMTTDAAGRRRAFVRKTAPEG